MPETFDLIVIGAGPGGYVAAIRAAQLGFNVAVVEQRETLGGVCLNEGCIPSKALLESSERYEQVCHGLSDHGIVAETVHLDLKRMMERKQGIIDKLTGGIAGLFKKNGISHFQGTGTLLQPNDETQRVQISQSDEDSEIMAKNVLLATGSRAAELPHIPFDADLIFSAREALSLPEVPRHLLVIGGGVIGLELGSVWRRLGAKVTVVEMLPQVVPQTDKQMAQLLQRTLKKQGIEILLNTRIDSVEKTDGGLQATLTGKDGEQVVNCDRILVATGRRSNSENLGLENVGLTANDSGQLEVDENYRTAAAGIYAIGDLIDGPMLAHKASEEGVVFAERMAGQQSRVDYGVIPAVTYTSPEVASVGRSEEGLKRDDIDFKAGKFYFSASGRALCHGDSEGFVKVLAAPETGRILGVHIIGPHASELIAEATAVLSFGGSVHDLALTCHAHPTLAEALKEAALAVNKEAIHA
ncbi:MAG TPA: dihydrolipoyl dehydrogenase [Geopsychrobacteraceae bacterium]|nr:dihydrolipoyl dehydrogenase [Geopsychrobacteraceae bacterium]